MATVKELSDRIAQLEACLRQCGAQVPAPIDSTLATTEWWASFPDASHPNDGIITKTIPQVYGDAGVVFKVRKITS